MRRRLQTRTPRVCFIVAAAVMSVSSAFAAKVTKVPDDAFAPLRQSVVTRKVRIDRLPIYDNTRVVIELEEFQVWAPGAKVIIHGDHGKVLEKLDPLPRRFFRGLVNGDPESFAFFSMTPSGRDIQGLIVTRDKKLAVNSSRRRGAGARGHNESDAADDTFLTEYDALDLLPESGEGWQCEVDKVSSHVANGRLHATGTDGHPIVAQGITGTQSYAISIEIETDFELYQNAGSNQPNLEAYITNLTGAVSTIYNRDLKTNVTQHNLHIYTTAADPWDGTLDAATQLGELGDYYHTNHGGPLGSGVILLSGKNVGSGIAWEGVVCSAEFLCSDPGCGTFQNHYGGPYAWCGLIGNGGLGLVPDPNGSQNGVLYGMPSGQQNYWPLEEYAHEFGHVMAGHHTHCITLSAAEQITYGRTFVDNCHSGEADPNTACYSGTTSVPLEKGTIMSYCHLFFSSGFPQSRYTFGQALEANHHELDDFMLHAGGPVIGGNNIVNAVGSFTISAITAPSSVPANSTGNNASISPTGGTYEWSLTNGTITGGATTNAVTFTAGSSGTMTLRATSYSTNGCGVTDTKTIIISPAGAAPTNVVAAATATNSVHVSWTAALGATSYHVYRSSDGTNYTQVGSTTNTFVDDSAGPPAVQPNTAYLYKVRSFDGSNESADSNIDLATTVIFTNAGPFALASAIIAADITQLRTAVDAVRKLANGGVANPGTYSTDPTITSFATGIKAAHITELRAALNPARATLSLTAVSYTDPTITAGSTTIKAAHITDLRSGVQ